MPGEWSCPALAWCPHPRHSQDHAKMFLLLMLAMLRGGSGAQDPKYKLHVEREVTVSKGLCAFVPCTVDYPREGWTESTKAFGYWYRELPYPPQKRLVASTSSDENVHLSTKGRFQLLGKPQDRDCSLLITEVWESDRGDYYFRVERGSKVRYSYIESKLTLKVTALTQKPDVYILEPLWPGRWATIICVFNATFEKCPAPTISWEGAAISLRGTKAGTHMSSVLTLAPRPEDHGTDLTCRAHFGAKGMSTTRTVQLDVAYPPRDPVISVSRAEGAAPQPQGRGFPSVLLAQKGHFLKLLCEADSLPQAALSWALEDRVLSYRPQGPKALALVLPAVTEGDAGTYTCRAENPLGSRNRTLHLTVQYPPENLRVMVSLENRTVLETSSNATSLPVIQGQSLQLLCLAHSNPPANLSWSQGRLTLSPGQSPEPGLLLLPHIQTHQEGEFTCSAQNLLGSQHLSVSIRVHSPPQLLGPSCSWEAPGLRCSCSTHAWPAPALRWRLDQELLQENRSDASFRVTSSTQGPWANSNLSLRAGLSAGLTLSCEARNVHGAQSASVLLLPDEKRALSKAFTNGALVGAGVLALLCLCVILVLVKTLKKQQKTKKGAQAERLSRRSTILDYINVFPRTRPPAQNQETKPSGPQPPPSAPSPQAWINQRQKQQYPMGPGGGPGPTAPTQAPQAGQDEVLYSTVHFHERQTRHPREPQEPRDCQEEYVEIRFR